MKKAVPRETAAPAGLRQRAEARLQASLPGGLASDAATDRERMLHELQVHQIELQLQNEELRRTQAETEAALERYADFHDFSPVGFLTLERDGRIAQINLTGARQLGLERNRLIDRRFAAFVAGEHLLAFDAFLQRVFAGEEKHDCELKLVIDGQLSRTVEIRAVLSPDRRECRAVVVDITERQHTAEMLRDLNQFNANVIDNAQQGIIVYGSDLRYRVWNEYMENLSGVRSADVLGRHPLEVFPFLKDSGVIANLESALAGGTAKSLEFPFENKQSGRSGWALDRNFPLQNAGGEIIGVIGTVSDITEQKQARDALNASYRFTRSLIDSMQDGFSAVDLDGVHLDLNPAMCRMTGFSREELAGTAVPYPYWPPEHRDFIAEEFRRVARGKFGILELIYMRRNGERFPVMITPYPVTDDAGNIVGYAATIKDITERKRTENALAATQQRFLDIVNTTDGIVWEADARTFDFTFVSRQAERLLGYPAADWLQPGFWIAHLHPDDRSWAPEYRQAYIARPAPHDFEYRFVARDGRTVWLRDIVTVVAEGGSPRWLRGIKVDITDRKLAEQRLREMADSLEIKVIERTAQLRKVAAQLTMAEERERRLLAQELHDNLGQLLAVMKIKLTSVSAGTLQPQIEQLVALVAQADQAARSITQQLSPPILHALGLVPALQWLAEDIERVYGVVVHVDHDSCPRRLIGEVQAVLYRSVRELLINVAKHAGVGAVSLSCLCVGTRLVLVVSDAGCGFEPSAHLGFSPEYRGFGLRSIHERIANIGGEMEIDSSPGNGTTVTLSLPHFIGKQEICNDPDNACRRPYDGA
jgi:PAS domain S-box-containing protein